MQRMGLGVVLVLTVLASLVAEAQQPGKAPRIGLLGGGSASAAAGRIDAFRQGLRDLGYVEGKTIVIEQMWAEGKLDRIPALAADLVRLKVDAIVSAGPTVTRACKDANITTPLSWGLMMILSAQGWSPVLRDLVETSRDCPAFPQALAQNNWNC
jgi:ABC-type uncharacterized transport system substrate-binding protein